MRTSKNKVLRKIRKQSPMFFIYAKISESRSAQKAKASTVICGAIRIMRLLKSGNINEATNHAFRVAHKLHPLAKFKSGGIITRSPSHLLNNRIDPETSNELFIKS